MCLGASEVTSPVRPAKKAARRRLVQAEGEYLLPLVDHQHGRPARPGGLGREPGQGGRVARQLVASLVDPAGQSDLARAPSGSEPGTSGAG